MTTNTPRTDAAAWWQEDEFLAGSKRELVAATDMRKLERELAAANEARERLRKALRMVGDPVDGIPCVVPNVWLQIRDEALAETEKKDG